MNLRLTLCVLCFGLIAAFAAAQQAPMPGGELAPSDGTPAPPKIYFSTAPDYCYPIDGLEYWIFVHSPAG